jgi:hypothetical protein
MPLRAVLLAVSAVLCGAGQMAVALAQPACPSTAVGMAVYVQNLSADPEVRVVLGGELMGAEAPCAGAGDISYGGTFPCTGHGLVKCVTITNLRPGAWLNRLTVAVSGSDVQMQARHDVLLAGDPGTVANTVMWTVFPRTFVVPDAAEATLRTQLDAAQAHAASRTDPALVTFARGAFPGAQAPQTIDLGEGPCVPEPGRHAALCLGGARIVVDALDSRGEPGAVVWSVGARPLPLLRVCGSDVVLRGFVLDGSRAAAPATQLDTVAIVGAGARRNRLERTVVHGPTRGDAVSVEKGAGDAGANANVIDACELSGARDKGVKVTTGAHATIQRSCVHDNANGGIQPVRRRQGGDHRARLHRRHAGGEVPGRGVYLQPPRRGERQLPAARGRRRRPVRR